MRMIFKAFGLALDDIGSPAFRSVLGLSLGVSLLFFAGLYFAVAAVLGRIVPPDGGWLAAGVEILGGFLFLVVAFLLFPPVMLAAVGLFTDRIAAEVERRHYPEDPPGRDRPLAEEILYGLRFGALVLGLNLLALPLYFVPGLNLVLFYGLNGYLLGRDYFLLAAMRQGSAAEATARARAMRGTLTLAGLLITFLMTIPLVALAAPLYAAAAMTHFETLARRRGEDVPR